VPNVPLAQKSFSTNPMILLGDEDQVEARFSPLGHSANVDKNCGDSNKLLHRLRNLVAINNYQLQWS
jgi:hypothetical protein